MRLSSRASGVLTVCGDPMEGKEKKIQVQVILGSLDKLSSDALFVLSIIRSQVGSTIEVGIDEWLAASDWNAINERLSHKVDVSFILSGIRWERLTKRLFSEKVPNPIVLTSNPALQYLWKLKPVLVIHWGGNINERISRSLQISSKLPLNYASHIGSYTQNNGVWVRRGAEYPYSAIRAWYSLLEKARKGYEFETWSASKGKLGSKFHLIELREDLLKLKPESGKTIQTIKMEEFCSIAQKWPGYKSGNILRSQLVVESYHTSYILSLLHWLEEERVEL
jgi:hypothetical protein